MPAEAHTAPQLRRAIVIGGSMAGLLAARVLADHAAQVVLIERDHFPSGAEPRKGVPQARHAHVLLTRGARILRRLFPGLEEDLLDAGAIPIDWMQHSRIRGLFGWMPHFASELAGWSCSRDLLEHAVRSRLRQLPNLRTLEGYDAVGLIPGPAGTVSGVRLRPRAGASVGELPALDADLVVDASGRGSRASEWLGELGYAAPAETTVDSFLGYASRLYHPRSAPPDWRVMAVRGAPRSNRGGVIISVEGGRWLVTLAGAERDYPPVDQAGFEAFVVSLGCAEFSEALAGAEPCSPIAGYQRTANRLRHYERVLRWPAGLITLGDAVCTFNPVYGQGMTTAAIGAELLDACLREQHAGGRARRFAQRFQHRLARANHEAWLMATGEDYRYPATEGGQRTVAVRLAHWYLDRVNQHAVADPHICQTLVEVTHLVRPAAALFAPSIVARVLGPRRHAEAAALSEALP